MKRGALHLFLTLGLVVGVLASVAPAAQAAGATRKVIISKVQQPTGSGAGGLVTSSSSPTQATQLNCGSLCTVSYARYAAVTVIAAADANSTLVGFSSNCPRNVGTNTCTITSLSADTTVAVTFARKQTLSVTKASSGGGSGTVAASGATGFSDCATAPCTATSSETYNSTIMLTATADATSRFMGWAATGTTGTLGCQSQPTAAQCSVTMAGARAVTATFQRTYPLTATKALSGPTASGTLTATIGATTSTCASTCSGRYISSESVTLAASPSTGSVFGGWEGDYGACPVLATSCSVPMDSARTVTARFRSIETLTVAVSGATGTVVSSPAGIDCPDTACTAPFPFGTSVTLTAASVESTAFRGWTGVSGCETTLVCTFTVGVDTAATANFGALNRLEVLRGLTGPALGTVTATIGDSAAASCATSCYQEPDTVVVLTAMPGADTRWGGWSGDCVLSGTDDTICTVTLATSETVTANFVALHDLDLTVVEDASYGGSVTVDDADADCTADASSAASACDATYDHGTTITLIATPDADTSVLWTGDIGACDATATTCVVPMTAAKSITATFSKTLFPLDVTIAGTGSGAVSGAVGEVAVFAACTASTCTTDVGIKEVVVLTAAPDAGSRFAGWSGSCTGSDTCTVTMTSAQEVTATFTARADVALTITESGGTGKVTFSAGAFTTASECSATCTKTYDTTDSVTLTAVPTMTLGAESKVGVWSGACSGAGTTCTLSMTSLKMVGITFVPLKYTLTATRSLLGTGTGTITSDVTGIDCPTDCVEEYPIRTPVVLTATPGPNTRFMGWSGGSCIGTDTCSVTMDAARTVTATFASLETLTVTKAGTRTGSVSTPDAQISCATECASDTGIYPWGTVVTVTAVGDGTSVIGGWSQNSCRTSTTCAVTVGSGTTLSVTFNPPSYALTVTKAGTGSGSVTSTSSPTQSSQINCGSTCSATYIEDTFVTLTASAASGSYFDSWQGACAGSSPTCTVKVTQVTGVTAIFGLPTLLIEISSVSGGSGSVSVSPGPKSGRAITCAATCSIAYKNTTTTVTITVSSASGSGFAGWGGACAASGLATSCVVTVDGAKTIGVTFGALIQVSATRYGLGSISMTTPQGVQTCLGDCSYQVVAGWLITWQAVPAEGYYLSSWSGACSAETSTTCSTTVSANTSVIAIFSAVGP